MPHPKLMVAFTGFEGDIQSLSQELSIQVASKRNRGFMTHTKKRSISPQAMAMLLSHVLYAKRQAPYYVEPVLVGLVSESGKPFLCSYDLIGAQSRSEAFCVAGVASKSLYGTAEALWRPHLSSEELVHVCGKAFLSALERDCLSGYGAIVYLITRDGIVEYDLACRND
jgi:20S proteasome subunit beta 3